MNTNLSTAVLLALQMASAAGRLKSEVRGLFSKISFPLPTPLCKVLFLRPKENAVKPSLLKVLGMVLKPCGLPRDLKVRLDEKDSEHFY